jgi:hypothetical protein
VVALLVNVAVCVSVSRLEPGPPPVQAAGDEAVEQVADHAGTCEEPFLDQSKPNIADHQRGFDGA